MNRCLSERALWLILEGEGTLADQKHVHACTACSARYRQLASDVRVLQTVLSGHLPHRVASRPAYPSRRPWLTAVAMVAVATVMVWSSVWLRGPSSPPPLPRGGQESVWPFLEVVSLALFAMADADVIQGIEQPELLPDALTLYAAFEVQWACDSEAWWFSSACDSQTFRPTVGP